jgi:hypothetical protein
MCSGSWTPETYRNTEDLVHCSLNLTVPLSAPAPPTKLSPDTIVVTQPAFTMAYEESAAAARMSCTYNAGYGPGCMLFSGSGGGRYEYELRQDHRILRPATTRKEEGGVN